MTTRQQKYYLKNREIITAKLKAKRNSVNNIAVAIEETDPEKNQSPILEVSNQTNQHIPDEKKYIDALRSMLIPSHRFVSLIPCKEDERGRPIFFYINKYPDENSTEISIVNLRYLKRGDETLIYQPDWDIVDETANIHDANLHNIMAFDENRIYEGGWYLEWRAKFRNKIF